MYGYLVILNDRCRPYVIVHHTVKYSPMYYIAGLNVYKSTQVKYLDELSFS